MIQALSATSFFSFCLCCLFPHSRSHSIWKRYPERNGWTEKGNDLHLISLSYWFETLIYTWKMSHGGNNFFSSIRTALTLIPLWYPYPARNHFQDQYANNFCVSSVKRIILLSAKQFIADDKPPGRNTMTRKKKYLLLSLLRNTHTFYLPNGYESSKATVMVQAENITPNMTHPAKYNYRRKQVS